MVIFGPKSVCLYNWYTIVSDVVISHKLFSSSIINKRIHPLWMRAVPSTHAILHTCKCETNFNASTFRTFFACLQEGGEGARFNSICKLTQIEFPAFYLIYCFNRIKGNEMLIFLCAAIRSRNALMNMYVIIIIERALDACTREFDCVIRTLFKWINIIILGVRWCADRLMESESGQVKMICQKNEEEDWWFALSHVFL